MLTWGLIAVLVVTMAGLSVMCARLSSMAERVEECENLLSEMHREYEMVGIEVTNALMADIRKYCFKWGRVWLSGEGIGRKGRHG